MNHFRLKMVEKLEVSSVRLQGEADELRRQANRLPAKFWHKRRTMREQANELASMARSAGREASHYRLTN